AESAEVTAADPPAASHEADGVPEAIDFPVAAHRHDAPMADPVEVSAPTTSAEPVVLEAMADVPAAPKPVVAGEPGAAIRVPAEAGARGAKATAAEPPRSFRDEAEAERRDAGGAPRAEDLAAARAVAAGLIPWGSFEVDVSSLAGVALYSVTSGGL